MYCPKCGTLNNDSAQLCSNCGLYLQQYGLPQPPPQPAPEPQPQPQQNYQQAQQPYRQQQLPRVPDYLVQAILVTICCCLPTGIVAIVKAAQVNGKLFAGDIEGALATSQAARFWCWVSFGLGLTFCIGYGLLIIFGIIEAGSQDWSDEY